MTRGLAKSHIAANDSEDGARGALPSAAQRAGGGPQFSHARKAGAETLVFRVLTGSRALQEAPAQRQPPQRPREDTSRDAEIARRLQQQLDREASFSAPNNGMIVAQPVTPAELPYKCGACGTTHVVRNVTHGATFDCAVCGAPNQILLAPPRVVVAYVWMCWSWMEGES